MSRHVVLQVLLFSKMQVLISIYPRNDKEKKKERFRNEFNIKGRKLTIAQTNRKTRIKKEIEKKERMK